MEHIGLMLYFEQLDFTCPAARKSFIGAKSVLKSE